MPQPTARPHSSADIPWYWQKINLFEGTEPGVREAFVKSAEQLQFRRGQHVFRADDLATRVFFLESGMIRIYHLSANGCVIIFWFCSPGDLFGAGGISGSLDQSVYGQAVEPSTVFLFKMAATCSGLNRCFFTASTSLKKGHMPENSDFNWT